MARDFAPLDLLYLYREQVLSILTRHGIVHPRIYGLIASGVDVPPQVPVEILVDVEDSRAWAAVDLHGVAEEVAGLIDHQVILVHCPPGAEKLAPGEQIIRL